MNTPMMQCGHAANAVDGNGQPSCVICHGIHPGTSKVAENQPSLEGRTARCTYNKRRDGKPCTSEEPSSSELAFFEHRPKEPHDRFYCGCWGWD